MSPSISALWEKYQSVRDQDTRALLLDQYLGLVHYSAARLASHIPRELDISDFISAVLGATDIEESCRRLNAAIGGN